jgi:hypothetical protein
MRALLPVMLFALLTGCPPRAQQPNLLRQRLSVKPTSLSVIHVKGAQLISSSAFTVFRLENAEGDKSALREASKQCASAKICGAELPASKVATAYEDLERAPWSYAVLGNHLVAVSRTAGSTQVFVNPAHVPEVGERISQDWLQGLVLCDPIESPVQPQCPPPPLPPRDLFLEGIVNPSKGI